MKVFGNKTLLGEKSQNIFELYKNNFSIPKSLIFEINEITQFDISKLKDNQVYILRSSFEGEDNSTESLAGFYKSKVFQNKILLGDFLAEYSNNLGKKLGGETEKLKSIIIQEFISTEIYGVYFTRNPENILIKGFYELGTEYDSVTSGSQQKKVDLSYFQEKELEMIGKKIEKIFNSPQDIEFCISQGKIIILQTRSITTGNTTIYNFKEIQKFNGVYTTLDFDELGDAQDSFSYLVLKNIFNIIYLNGRIYFKKSLFPYFYFKNFNLIKDRNLKLFLVNYKKYLIQKFKFKIFEVCNIQKLDKDILKKIFKKYSYSFLLEKKSNNSINFEYNNINAITKAFLKIEKQKKLAFHYLEKYKGEYRQNKKIHLVKEKNIKLNEKLLFKNGIILNTKQKQQRDFEYIYSGKISGKITNLKNFKYKKDLNQILILENLDLNLYDKLDYITGLIVQNGNLLSHNSIVLREYKIPSIIKYKRFGELKVGEKFSI